MNLKTNNAASGSLDQDVSPRWWRVRCGDPKTQTMWTLWGESEDMTEAKRIAESKVPSGCIIVESRAWANKD